MYFGGDIFRVSFKWVVMISTKQRGSYTYTEYKSQHMLHTLALWGLVTNYGEGGLQNGKGGASEVLPLQKGGEPEKSFSHAEWGGHKKF